MVWFGLCVVKFNITFYITHRHQRPRKTKPLSNSTTWLGRIAHLARHLRLLSLLPYLNTIVIIIIGIKNKAGVGLVGLLDIGFRKQHFFLQISASNTRRREQLNGGGWLVVECKPIPKKFMIQEEFDWLHWLVM